VLCREKPADKNKNINKMAIKTTNNSIKTPGRKKIKMSIGGSGKMKISIMP